MMTIIKLLFNLKLNKTKDRFKYIMERKIYSILINKIFQIFNLGFIQLKFHNNKHLYKVI
jgi:hypothetical protein